MRLLALFSLVLSVFAQPRTDRDKPGPWKRRVMTPKNSWYDNPAAHDLAYFTRYPAMLDESGDFCPSCSQQEKLSLAQVEKEPTAEVHLVGTIKGLDIYDVFYRFTG